MAILRPSSDIITGGWNSVPGIVTSKQPWRKQPQVLAALDRGNPINNGILSAINNSYSTMKGRLPTSLGAVGAIGSSGVCLDYSGGKTQYAYDAELSNGCATSAGCSVFVLFDVDTLTNYSGLISLQDTTTLRTAFEIRLGVESAGSEIHLIRGGSSSYATGSTGSNRLSAWQTRIPLLVVFGSEIITDYATVYVGGVSHKVGLLGTSQPVAAPTTNGLCLGGRSPDTTTKLDGRIYMAAVWGRALTGSEANSIIANPWQVFKPRETKTYFLPPLYSTLDETSADDGDFIESNTAGQIARIGLETGTDPANDNDHQLNYRIGSEGDRGAVVRVVQQEVTICGVLSCCTTQIVTSKHPWTSQPQYPVGTNKAFDTRFILLPSVAHPSFECVSQRLCSGLAYPGVCQGGVSQNFSTTGSRYADNIVLNNCNFGTSDFAVGVVGVFESTTSIGVAMSGDTNQDAGSNQWRMQPNYNGTAISASSFCFLTYGGTLISTGADAVITGKLQSFLGVRRGATLELWCDGMLIASNTGSVQNVSGSETQSIGFGWGGYTTYVAGGHRVLGYGIAGTLLASQASILSKNPWQIFKPKEVKTYFDLGRKVIAEQVHPSFLLSATPSNSQLILPPEKAALITDYSKLAMEVEST